MHRAGVLSRAGGQGEQGGREGGCSAGEKKAEPLPGNSARPDVGGN